MDDRVHARKVVGYEGEVEDLAVELGRLTYDQVSSFLGALATELARQAEGDFSRGRIKLAADLENASDAIFEAQAHIDNAWDICVPHMRPEELE